MNTPLLKEREARQRVLEAIAAGKQVVRYRRGQYELWRDKRLVKRNKNLSEVLHLVEKQK